jgi:hypothetical protein
MISSLSHWVFKNAVYFPHTCKLPKLPSVIDFFETGSHFVAQTGHKLTIQMLSPMSAGITSMCCHAQKSFIDFLISFQKHTFSDLSSFKFIDISCID